MFKKRICFITGSRADYGHAYWLLNAIDEDLELELEIIITGSHLSEKFGFSKQEIITSGFRVSSEINLLCFDDNEVGIAKSVGLGCEKFAVHLGKIRPDCVLVFGDRYEIFSAVVASFLLKIPIVHVHGGETSQGAFDEGLRHSITKMASIHFVATEEYRRRVIQLGENPKRVLNYGAPGLDNLKHLRLLSQKEFELAFPTDRKKTALVTYHPVTLESDTALDQITELLEALEQFEFSIIFTKANADPQGQIINERIIEFCAKNRDRASIFDNLGQIKYLSCLKYCNIMVGNSSSGLVEAPSFKMPVVNVGDRQKGRIKAKNVIDVTNNKSAIINGIEKVLSSQFIDSLKDMQNPYLGRDDGNISVRIKDFIKEIRFGDSLLKKQFFDVK